MSFGVSEVYVGNAAFGKLMDFGGNRTVRTEAGIHDNCGKVGLYCTIAIDRQSLFMVQ